LTKTLFSSLREGTFGACSGGKDGMKGMASKLAVFVLLFTLAAGVQTVMAQYTSDGGAFILVSPISIVSPSNSTYSSGVLLLNVTFKFLLSPSCADVSYSLDGKSNITLPLTATHEPVEATRTYANGTTVIVNSTFMVPFTVTGWAVVPDLAEGAHNVTVYARYTANNIIGLDNSTIYFTIDPNSKQNIPEFPSSTILPLLFVAALIVTVCKKGLPKKPSNV
jgi:hypothetical protein